MADFNDSELRYKVIGVVAFWGLGIKLIHEFTPFEVSSSTNNWINAAILLWPAVVVAGAGLIRLLFWGIAELFRRHRASKEAAAREEKRKKDLQIKMEWQASRIRNIERVQEKVLELDTALQSLHDAEVAKNILTARNEYPFLMKTVEDEESFLRDISNRHPNISGFVQTRSVGDSEVSSVAKLGRFLEQVETT